MRNDETVRPPRRARPVQPNKALHLTVRYAARR